MKLFINARFLTQPVSGVQRYGIECSRQIKALYPDCVFVTPVGVLHHDVAKELGAIVVGKRSGHIWEQVDLPRYLAGQGYPPLVNLANTGPVYYKNNFCVIHDLAFFHHPEWNSRLFATWYNFMVPRLARNSKHIFTVSNTVKNELQSFFHLPPGKISVTYNGLGSGMSKAAGGNVAKEKIIITVGTFNLRKNQHTLVRAFLQSTIKDEYKLVLAGDRNKIFADSGVAADVAGNRVEILEKLTDEQLVALYQRAEILVSLSNYEGFGIPVLEGLFWKCKVLCSDIPVYHELFEPYVGFCDQNSVADVAARLTEIANSGRVPADADIAALQTRYNYKEAAQTIIDRVVGLNK